MTQKITPLTEYELWKKQIDPAECHKISMVLMGNQRPHDETDCFEDWKSVFWVANWKKSTQKLFEALGNQIVADLEDQPQHFVDPTLEYYVQSPETGKIQRFYGQAHQGKWIDVDGRNWGH